MSLPLEAVDVGGALSRRRTAAVDDHDDRHAETILCCQGCTLMEIKRQSSSAFQERADQRGVRLDGRRPGLTSRSHAGPRSGRMRRKPAPSTFCLSSKAWRKAENLSADRIHPLEKIRMVIYGNHAVRASVTAMKSVFATILKDGGIHNVNGEIVPVEEIFRLQAWTASRPVNSASQAREERRGATAAI